MPHFSPHPCAATGPLPCSYSFLGIGDEDDDDNDDVEHDVKDAMIVDSRCRLEQHNIMSSTTGAHSKKEDKEQEIRTSKTADAGRTNIIIDAIVDMNGGGEDRNKWS